MSGKRYTEEFKTEAIPCQLKSELQIYKTRKDARRDIFDYIEMFFNPNRKHGYNGNLSPAEFEKQYFVKLGSVQDIGGHSAIGND